MFLSNSDILTNESIEIIEKASKEKISKNDFDTVFRHLHTLKGNARGFGMSLLSELVHRSENNLEGIKSNFEDFNEEARTQIANELTEIRELLDYFIRVPKRFSL